MSTLVLLTWNPWVGNRPRRVRRVLRRWTRKHRPHVIVITEARPFYGVLRQIPGYRVYQERPRPKGRIVDDRGDTAILVRRDVRVKRRRKHKMRVMWKVFSHNRWHTPRRYEGVKVRIDGLWWKVRGSHFPTNGFSGGNSRAFRESARRSKRWALRSDVPTVDAGDLNENRRDLKRFYGPQFKVRGRGVDLIVARKVSRIRRKVKGKGGSDVHRGQVFYLTAN